MKFNECESPSRNGSCICLIPCNGPRSIFRWRCLAFVGWTKSNRKWPKPHVNHSRKDTISFVFIQNANHPLNVDVKCIQIPSSPFTSTTKTEPQPRSTLDFHEQTMQTGETD